MPKVVDHDQRRRDLTLAALDLVAEGGRSAASVRALADATGWSPGAVRHYLPTSATLETLLLEHVSGRVQQRVTDQVQRAGRSGWSRRELVARMLEQILPLDAERLVEHRIWVTLYIEDPSRAAELAWAWTGQRLFHRQLVMLLAGAASVPDHPERLPELQEAWAAHLHAYVDGLALRIASGIEPLAESRAGLRGFLHAVEAAVAEESDGG